RRKLPAALGPDRARWRYGALNVMAVHHPLGRALPLLGRLFDPPALEMGGGSATPNVLSIAPDGAVEGPSMRFIADMADADNTRRTHFMGEAGGGAARAG